MFDKWLLFFYSNKMTINKNKIKKEFLEEGEMKISGEKPVAWSIIIKPEVIVNIYEIIYEKENKKKDAIILIKEGLVYKDKKIFEEGIQIYETMIKEINKLKEEFNMNNKAIETIESEIFELKRKMYYEKNLDKVFSNADKVVELESKKKQLEQEKNTTLNNYVISQKSLIKKGPVPDPPTIKTELYKAVKQKFKFDTELTQKNTENIIKEEENSNSNIYKKDGGFIKVIKLS